MSRNSKRIFILIIVIFAVCTLLGCESKNEKKNIKDKFEVNSEDKNSKKIVIGIVVHDLEHEFMSGVTAYLKEEAKKYNNVQLIILDSSGQNAKQMNQIDYLIDKKVDGIIINPNDQFAINPYIKKTLKEGIPIVIVNMKVKGNIKLPYIGTEDEEAGILQGEYIAKQLKGKGNILLIMGALNQVPTISRYKGLMKVLNQYPEINVIDKKYGNWERFTGLHIMEEWLEKYDDFDAVVSQNDEMILGALTVLEKKGVKVKTIGLDGIPEAIEAIKEGRLSASVYQDAKKEAQLSLELILREIRGEKIETNTKVDYNLITVENVDEYLNETYYLNKK